MNVQTAVSTALPTIVSSINGYKSSDFIWIGSAYSLAATAILPFSGALAQVYSNFATEPASNRIFRFLAAVQLFWQLSASFLWVVLYAAHPTPRP